MSYSVEIYNLTKIYPSLPSSFFDIKSISIFFKKVKHGIVALKNINLKIKEGEIIGLYGPNGAGKTTLCKILVNIVTPTIGTVKILGYDVSKNFKKK